MSTPLLRTFRAGTPALLRRAAGLSLACAFSALATSAQAASLTLAWDPSPSTTITGYNVYVSTAPGAANTRKIAVGKQLTAAVDALVQGKTYYFSVTAHDGAGTESTRSNEVARSLPFGDVNFDGMADVVWRNKGTGGNQVWQMQLGGLTREGAPLSLPTVSPGSGYSLVATGDVNNDGKTDYVWRNANGDNQLWLMNVTTILSTVTLPVVADPNWEVVGSGDFNADSTADIFWRNRVTGAHQVWLMSTAGVPTIVSAPSSPPSSGWRIVGIGDADGDGRSDLFWRNTSGSNYIWIMNGGRVTLPAALPFVADTNWDVIGTGDFNGDGNADVFWRNKQTGQQQVWIMNGATRTAFVAVPTVLPSSGWQIAAIRDTNGDGRTDLIWRNVSGSNYVWLMNSGTVIGQASLPAVADANWEIVSR